MFMKIFGVITSIICLWFIIIFIEITFIFGIDTCSKYLIETVKSPNGEYIIKTYLRNCGATIDFEIVDYLCDKNNKCKKIYSGYHESVPFVYWIDNEYKLDEFEADYIDKMATSIFAFNKSNCFNGYDFTFKIVDLEKKSTNEYLLKIDNNNKMYLINSGKMSKLNRTDYEYMKKILTFNDLYNFS